MLIRMSFEDSRQTIASICSTLSFFCEDSILELDNFDYSKNNLLHSSEVKIQPDCSLSKLANIEDTSCPRCLEYDGLHSNCFCNEKNNKFNLYLYQNNAMEFSLNSKNLFFLDEKSIDFEVKKIIYLFFDQNKIKDIFGSKQFFTEFQIKKQKNKEFLLNFFRLSSEDLKQNLLTDIHDSTLMEKFMFNEAMKDILVITQHISTRKLNSDVVTSFDASSSPSISIKDYLMRLSEFFLCSPSLFILMFIYIKRILENNPSYVFDSMNAHRLMLATLILSVKLYDDKLLSNSHYAHVGGVSEIELARLEVDALKLMNFRLKVTLEEFIRFSYSVRLVCSLLKKNYI